MQIHPSIKITKGKYKMTLNTILMNASEKEFFQGMVTGQIDTFNQLNLIAKGKLFKDIMPTLKKHRKSNDFFSLGNLHGSLKSSQNFLTIGDFVFTCLVADLVFEKNGMVTICFHSERLIAYYRNTSSLIKDLNYVIDSLFEDFEGVAFICPDPWVSQ